MSYSSPCEPSNLHSLASSSTILPTPVLTTSCTSAMIHSLDEARPDNDGDAYIRDASPYMAFLDNSANSNSPIARNGGGGEMSSSPHAGFASANSASASALDSASNAQTNALMQFTQPSNNDQMLFEFDDFSQYLAFNDPRDASLNDMGGGTSSPQVASYISYTDSPAFWPDSSLYPAHPSSAHFDTSPTDPSIYSPLNLPSPNDYRQFQHHISTPRSIGATSVVANAADLYTDFDGDYSLANSYADTSSASTSASGSGGGVGINGARCGNTGAWPSPTAPMHHSHADFAPGASHASKDALLSPYPYSPFIPSSAVPMPISTSAMTGTALSLPDGSSRPLSLPHSRDGSDDTRIHAGEVTMMANPGFGNVGDDTAIAAGIAPTELAGAGDLMHQRHHQQMQQLRAVNRNQQQQQQRLQRPSLQRTSPRSRPQFVSQLWDAGANVTSPGPLRVPHSYSFHGKSPSPEPYGYPHSRSRSRSSLSPTLAPSSPSSRTYNPNNLFAFPLPSSAPPQASVLRAAGRMRTYSQRGGTEALKAVASAKKEPREYDFGSGMGMELDSEFDPDPEATIRKKKRTSSSGASTVFGDGHSPRSSVEPSTPSAAIANGNAPLKSELRPPKLAPSTWQLYFTDWIQRHQLQSDKKLNVAQAAKEAGAEYANLTPEQKEPFRRRSQAAKEARERELAAWQRTLTPEAIKRENAFRAAQRKAGKSRKGNIKDPNAPKKPLSAYFMFLQHIRANRLLVREVFGDEKETTSQSVLAAAKWRSMTDDERKPFLAQAEKEKLEYEAARRMYEEGTVGFESTINFNINTDTSVDFSNTPATTFVIARPVSEQSSDSDADSEDFVPDEDRRLPNRV